jgi:hypothetical protein
MNGTRQPPPGSSLAWFGARDSLILASGYLILVGFFDFCLASALRGPRMSLGRDLEFLGALAVQALFLSLLVRHGVVIRVVATLALASNLVLVNAVIASYSAQHVSHVGYASAFLAGQLAFLAIWLVLGGQPLGWRVLGICAGGGLLIVIWYGYAARRSTAEWNLIWMSETAAVLAAAVLLRMVGFRIRYVGEKSGSAGIPVEKSTAEGEGQYKLWHLLAGLFVASCLLGLARLLGVIKPTYFADLAANEIDAADLRRGLGVGLAASLAVAFAALSVLLRANFLPRYLPALVYALAMGYAIHTWGPKYVVPIIGRVMNIVPMRASGWIPSASQWPLWMLFNAGMAMSGTMFLHALGYRLTRGQATDRVATNAK